MPPTFRSEEQEWVLVNLCHEQLSPRCDKPGIRIVGFFATKEDANRKKERILRRLDKADRVDFYVIETFKPFIICKNRRRQNDPRYQNHKILYIAEIRDQWLDLRKQEFKEHQNYIFDPEKEDKKKDTSANLKNPFRERPKGKKSKKKVPVREQAIKAKQEKEQLNWNKVDQEYPREFELRDQNYATIAWLKDVTPAALSKKDAQELFMIVFRGFDDEKAANEWVNGPAAEQVLDPPLEVVRMYGWLYPSAINYEEVDHVYGHNDKLDTYMKEIKKETERAENFETWCMNNDVKVPVVDIQEVISEDYQRPQASIEIFDSKEDTMIPDDQAVYYEVPAVTSQDEPAKPLKKLPPGKVKKYL